MLYKDLVSVYEKIDCTTKRLEKSTVCPSCHKEMSSHDTAQVIQCMRNFIKS